MRSLPFMRSAFAAIVFGLIVGVQCTLIFRDDDSLRRYFNVFRYEPFVAFLQLVGILELATVLALILTAAGIVPRIALPCVCFALMGAALFGGSAIIGTTWLGHIRPMWMELDSSFALAKKGAIVGVLAGFAAGLFAELRGNRPTTALRGSRDS